MDKNNLKNTALIAAFAEGVRRTDVVTQILACNEISERFGLALTEKDVAALMVAGTRALKETRRVEFGGGILPKLIYAFCDSPYITPDNYESTLEDLQDAFYYFKGEAEEMFTDDELIEYMEKVFNGKAAGSTEYLLGTSMVALCRYARMGHNLLNADEEDLF